MRFAPSIDTKAVRRDPTPNGDERPQGQRQPVYPVALNRKDRPYQDQWTIQRAVDMALMRSVWVFRAVIAIATNQAKLPIVARRDDWVDGKVISSNVADRLNFNPTRNRAFNASIFRRMTSMQVLLNRQGCMQEVTPTRSGDLYSLNLFPPNYCWPIPDPRNYVSEFMVRYPGVDEFKIPADRVIWIREPHPTDIYSGITPLEPLGLSVETDWYQRLYNRNFILNDARPGGFLVLKAGDTLDPEDWADIRARFGNGPQAAGRFEIIDGDNAQWIDGATTPRDAQYAELRKAVRDEILEGFGVPESIAGNASNRTFANADAEQEVFWRETMLPHLELLARAWDQLTPEDDIFISFDWTRVPILERDIREQREKKFREYQGGAISLDEYRIETGREAAASGEAGKTDRLYVGIGLQEVGSATDKDWEDPALAMQQQMGGGFPGEGDQGALPPGDEGGPPPEDQNSGTFPEPVNSPGGDTGMDTTWGDEFFKEAPMPRTADALEGKSDAELLAIYEDLAMRFEAKDGPRAFEAKDALAEWIRHHGAWESTVAHGLEAHFEAQERVVLQKLTGARQAKAYEAWLQEEH
jgi:HK97 family phage portal protein